MANILDQAIHVGVESTYGTAETGTVRSFEGKADSFKREAEFIDSVGFRSGLKTLIGDRRVQVNKGGVASLEMDVLNKGFGLLLQTLGSTTGPTQVLATTAYDTTVVAASDEPGTSYTIQVVRVDTGGTERVFTHEGCVATGFKLSGEVGGLAMVSFDYDWEDVTTATAEATPTYVASTEPFPWDRCTVQIDDTTIDATSFEFNGDLAMKVDRHYLKGSALKSEPLRAGVPQYTGSISAHLEDLTLYNLFENGTEGKVYIKWEGTTDQIESGYTYERELTIPAVRFEGSSPEASLSDLTTIDLPFRVVDDLSNEPWTLVYRSTDTAL